MKLRKQTGRTERLSKSYDSDSEGDEAQEEKFWEYKIIVIS